MQRVQVQSLVGELRSDMPCSQKIKTENRNNIVTNSIQTFKKVHIKQFFKKTHIKPITTPPCIKSAVASVTIIMGFLGLSSQSITNWMTLSRRNLFFHSFGGQKSEIMVFGRARL